ncbi:MAG: YeeE/YedE thiosulfate transporter family protein [Vicingaceae bacterium]
MIEFIKQPWPWYIAGPIIAAVYGSLLFFGKSFGISATLRSMCSAMGAGKRIDFFDFDWKGQMWNLMFVLGAVIGGFIATMFLSEPMEMQLSEVTKENLTSYGLVSWKNGIAPVEIFNWASLITAKGFIMMVLGGFLIGFGSRYSGGCTSGHAISGLSNLQLPSLVAVIGFFIGGLFITWLVLPHLLTM